MRQLGKVKNDLHVRTGCLSLGGRGESEGSSSAMDRYSPNPSPQSSPLLRGRGGKAWIGGGANLVSFGNNQKRRTSALLAKNRWLKSINASYADETGLSGGNLAQNSAEFVKVHRFAKMEIEPGLFAALNVFSCAKTGERYRFDRAFSLGFGNHVVAAAIGQRDAA